MRLDFFESFLGARGVFDKGVILEGCFGAIVGVVVFSIYE